MERMEALIEERAAAPNRTCSIEAGFSITAYFSERKTVQVHTVYEMWLDTVGVMTHWVLYSDWLNTCCHKLAPVSRYASDRLYQY